MRALRCLLFAAVGVAGCAAATSPGDAALDRGDPARDARDALDALDASVDRELDAADDPGPRDLGTPPPDVDLDAGTCYGRADGPQGLQSCRRDRDCAGPFRRCQHGLCCSGTLDPATCLCQCVDAVCFGEGSGLGLCCWGAADSPWRDMLRCMSEFYCARPSWYPPLDAAPGGG